MYTYIFEDYDHFGESGNGVAVICAKDEQDARILAELYFPHRHKNFDLEATLYTPNQPEGIVYSTGVG